MSLQNAETILRSAVGTDFRPHPICTLLDAQMPNESYFKVVPAGGCWLLLFFYFASTEVDVSSNISPAGAAGASTANILYSSAPSVTSFHIFHSLRLLRYVQKLKKYPSIRLYFDLFCFYFNLSQRNKNYSLE